MDSRPRETTYVRPTAPHTNTRRRMKEGERPALRQALPADEAADEAAEAAEAAGEQASGGGVTVAPPTCVSLVSAAAPYKSLRRILPLSPNSAVKMADMVNALPLWKRAFSL